MSRKIYNKSVFINCPFDDTYRPLFRAAVFTVFSCDFIVRCADEEQDSSEIRLDKIFRMITECKFGIHDLSFTEIDDKTKHPRFNMPFELGIFLGAKRFGCDEHYKKNCLVFEKHPHSYEKYISDIKGQDIASHEKKPQIMIRKIRDWLAANSKRNPLPGGAALWKQYQKFLRWLPQKCKKIKIKNKELTYLDFANLVFEWNELR